MALSPIPPALFASTGDAVRGDAAQMAMHMRQCAQARGHCFGLRSGLQRVSSATAGRLVTVAFVTTLLVCVLAAFG